MAELRIDYEGAWHHVMNRGAKRETVFHTARDARVFLDLVGEWAEPTGTEIHAYCLMGNHYHVLVRSTGGQLSPFMQRVGAGYTRHLNQCRGTDGAVFRGRFRSKVVDTDTYLSVVHRYIHRNPLARTTVDRLDRYRWSSYPGYVGTAAAPDWLRTDVLLDRFGRDPERLRRHTEGPRPVSRPDLLAELVRVVVDEESARLRQQTVRLERVMATALLDHLDPDVAAALALHLGFATDPAGRENLSRARRRARQKVTGDDVLRDVLARIVAAVA